jgi:hypothetical protein
MVADRRMAPAKSMRWNFSALEVSPFRSCPVELGTSHKARTPESIIKGDCPRKDLQNHYLPN